MIVLTPADYRTTAWSGGTTTQLAIAPEGAVYADRDFLWRVSSAAVRLPESDFTPLPDYVRLISTLEGEIDLSHNGGAFLHLRPLEIHRFDGADRTVSRGQCTDFNLMLRKGRADGTVAAFVFDGTPQILTFERGLSTVLVFCVSGSVTAEEGPERAVLGAGQTARCEHPDFVRLVVGNAPTRFLVCKIREMEGKVESL